MPVYNFYPQFVPLILDGTKYHTIRRVRKHRTKVGDTIKMSIGLRTKNYFLFVETLCVKIVPVVIWPYKEHLIANIHTSIEKIVKDDGFEDTSQFFDFFKRYKRECLDDFEFIYWDPKALKVKYGTYDRFPSAWRKQVEGDWSEVRNEA